MRITVSIYLRQYIFRTSLYFSFVRTHQTFSHLLLKPPSWVSSSHPSQLSAGLPPRAAQILHSHPQATHPPLAAHPPRSTAPLLLTSASNCWFLPWLLTYLHLLLFNWHTFTICYSPPFLVCYSRFTLSAISLLHHLLIASFQCLLLSRSFSGCSLLPIFYYSSFSSLATYKSSPSAIYQSWLIYFSFFSSLYSSFSLNRSHPSSLTI
jgi:hypothetical protein